jgi:uncharacterized protein (DUF2235 family)
MRHGTSAVARNLVVLADGTGNSASKAFKTNVWRLYQALDLGGIGQVATFSDGVGTSTFKPFEIVGLALGFGVKRRVMTLYKFLCRNYRDGDRIYAFGFSRGAFTVRVLAGLIERQGLVDFGSEEELDRKALAAYRANREVAFPATWRMPWVVAGRWARDAAVRLFNRSKTAAGPARPARKVGIRFLGVWDTVAAYGLPIHELTQAFNKYVWPMTFEKSMLLDCVENARQALSVDDERRTFFPIPWSEAGRRKDEVAVASGRLLQVWFTGVHSNVGGGYPDDRLAHVPLCWMIGEAARCGLQFKPDVVAGYWDYASDNGRIYDSRAMLGMFYRYHPRSAAALMGSGVVPVVDASVVVRMAAGGDGYAPVSLPRNVNVLLPSGACVPFHGMAPKGAAAAAAPDDGVDRLPLPADRPRDLARMDAEVLAAMDQLDDSLASHNRVKRVTWLEDTIWWRRVLYFAMLAVAVLVALFPFYADGVRYEPVESIDAAAAGVFGPIAGLLKGFLPGFAAPWLEAIARHPLWASVLGTMFGLSLWLNGWLRTRIVDRARAVWNVTVHKDSDGLDDSRSGGKQRSTLIVGMMLLVFAAIVSRVNIIAGLVFAAIGVVAVLATVLIRRAAPRGEGGGRMLDLAHRIRTSTWGAAVSRLFSEHVLPNGFLIVSGLAILMVAIRLCFDVAASAGALCAEPPAKVTAVRDTPLTAGPFATSDPCWDTGLWVEEGVTYRVELNTTAPWIDGDGYQTDVRGFAAADHGWRGGLVFYPGTLLKRWWGQPWFKPIARVGRRGNDEYPLDSVRANKTVPRNQAKILVARLTPTRSGELYLYVNDAVGIPGMFGRYYRNNQGSATVTVSEADN